MSIKIEIAGETPMEVLATVIAFALHGMKDSDALAAANKIYEEEVAEPVRAAPTNIHAPNYTPPVEAAAPPAQVPLADAPVYTVEQLAHAGADLVMRDPAKGAAAQTLLQQFGVTAVTELPRERYGEFATALRGLGASI